MVPKWTAMGERVHMTTMQILYEDEYMMNQMFHIMNQTLVKLRNKIEKRVWTKEWKKIFSSWVKPYARVSFYKKERRNEPGQPRRERDMRVPRGLVS